MPSRLLLMSAPAQVATREDVAWDFLSRLVKEDPQITWGEYRVLLDAYENGVDGMNGWLTKGLKAVGSALDVVTFGQATKVLLGTKNVVTDAFSKKKIADSLKEASEGVKDDMLSSLLDALPFDIGKHLRTGKVVNDFWPILLIIGVVVCWFFFFRKR